MTTFTHFVGVDWSGARGARHPALAVAISRIGSDGSMLAPRLVSPPDGKKAWSRTGFIEWLTSGMGLKTGAHALVGLDSAFSLPYLDEGAFLPTLPGVGSAVELWQAVDQLCEEALDLYGGPFVSAHGDYYLRTGMRGPHFKRRLRKTEVQAITSGAGPCESVFHLIGPSQVGMSGLSTMRALQQVRGHEHIEIWPMCAQGEQPYPPGKPRITVVEIYAAQFARLGGVRGKIRDWPSLNKALETLGSKPIGASIRQATNLTDHAGDAIITSAGLRCIANDDKYWHPEGLSTMVRRTEGWIFGVL